MAIIADMELKALCFRYHQQRGMSDMSDLVVFSMTAGLCVSTWGLIVLCDRLQGGGR